MNFCRFATNIRSISSQLAAGFPDLFTPHLLFLYSVIKASISAQFGKTFSRHPVPTGLPNRLLKEILSHLNTIWQNWKKLAHRYAIFLCSWDVEIWYDDRVVWQQTRKKRTCLVLYFFESDVSADDMTDRGSGDQIRANPLFIKSLQKNLVLLLLARPQFRFSGPISLLVILTLSFLSQRVTS